MDRRSFIASLLAAAVIGVSAEEPADARRRSSRSNYRRRSTTSRRSYGGGYSVPAGARSVSDDGECSCRSGKVCIGPRGGRYCITSGGNKRYGV